jgi:hypothetical protein
MTDVFINKNVKLSLEFDEYLAKHPSAYDKIPNGAFIVITLKSDPKFSRQSVSLVKKVSKKPLIEAQKSSSGWSIKPLQLNPAL